MLKTLAKAFVRGVGSNTRVKQVIPSFNVKICNYKKYRPTTFVASLAGYKSSVRTTTLQNQKSFNIFTFNITHPSCVL